MSGNYKHTEETKKKISLAMKKIKRKPRSEETRRKISQSEKGKKVSEDTKKKISLKMKGRKISYATRLKMSIARRGKKNHFWKGGKSKHYKTGYYSFEYKEWRKAIFERDNWTCQECIKNKCYVTAHHIKSFANYPKLRFNLNNGVTLCEECHKKTDNYKGRSKSK